MLSTGVFGLRESHFPIGPRTGGLQVRARRFVAGTVMGIVAKVGVQASATSFPVIGGVEPAGACGYGAAPTTPNPAKMHNSNNPPAYYGKVTLQYDPCSRLARAAYSGFTCTLDSGCGTAAVHSTANQTKNCNSPLGSTGCTTLPLNDAGFTSFAKASFDSDLSTPYVGLTGSY